MKSFHVLLICNGSSVSKELLEQLSKQADVTVAADGGAAKAVRAGIVPDWVIGDLDSISKRMACRLGKRIVKVSSQENTDLEKSLSFILRSFPVTRLTVVGLVGGRWDFSLGNVLHLIAYATKMDITLAGDGWRMHVLAKEARFDTLSGKRVSLVPLAPCSGVTLSGLKYPLQNASLPVGTTRSLSNQTVARQFRVTLKRGVLLVYREV